MIVTIAKVAHFDQFLQTFSTKGVEDYEGFLEDPEIPVIARELAPREPPVKADPVAQYAS